MKRDGGEGQTRFIWAKKVGVYSAVTQEDTESKVMEGRHKLHRHESCGGEVQPWISNGRKCKCDSKEKRFKNKRTRRNSNQRWWLLLSLHFHQNRAKALLLSSAKWRSNLGQRCFTSYMFSTIEIKFICGFQWKKWKFKWKLYIFLLFERKNQQIVQTPREVDSMGSWIPEVHWHFGWCQPLECLVQWLIQSPWFKCAPLFSISRVTKQNRTK